MDPDDIAPENKITLLVGPDKQAFTADGELLSGYSEFIATALKKEWLEGQQRIISLPEEKPELIETYLESFEGDAIPYPLELTDRENDREELHDYSRHLAALHCLSQRIMDSTLRHDVMEELVRLFNMRCDYDCYRYPEIEVVNLIYESSPASCAVRRILADGYHRRCHNQDHIVDEDDGEISWEFLRDVAVLAIDSNWRNYNSDKDMVLKSYTWY